MVKTSNNKKTNQKNININCDLGQSFGVYRSELELALLPYVSSVSIACGQHAGDPLIIKNLLRDIPKTVCIGAHVGYPDIQGFGYRDMQLDEKETEAVVVYQVGALSSLAKIYNRKTEFVRPHGALYKRISEDYESCLAFLKAISAYDPWLVVIGPSGENLDRAAEETNIRVCREIQLDKKYDINGNIYFSAGDVVDYDYSVSMLESLVKDSTVPNTQGGKTRLEFNSIHLNMKSRVSIDIAKKAKELIPHPMPVAGTFVADSGWLE